MSKRGGGVRFAQRLPTKTAPKHFLRPLEGRFELSSGSIEVSFANQHVPRVGDTLGNREKPRIFRVLCFGWGWVGWWVGRWGGVGGWGCRVGVSRPQEAGSEDLVQVLVGCCMVMCSGFDAMSCS